MNDKTYQVRCYRDGYGKGTQIATNLPLDEAVEVAFRLTQWEHLEGGTGDFTILPD